VAGGVTVDLGNTGTLAIRGFYAHEDYNTDNVAVTSPTSSFVSNAHKTTSDDYGLSLVWSKAFDGPFARVTAGADYRYIDGQDDQDVFNVPGIVAANVVGGGKQGAFGIFGEATVKPTAATEILATLRYDDFRNTDGRIVVDGVPQTFADRAFDVWSGRLAARYQLNEPLALRASYYTGFRVPTLAELYRSFETPTFRALSNPELARERVNGGDIGMDFRSGRFTAQVTWFYNTLKDFVGSAEVGFINGKFTVQNANVARILSRGVEVGTSFALTPNWSAFLNYTYTDATVTEGPFTGNMNEGSPRNVLGAGVGYRDANWNVNLRGRWLSHSYQDISNTALQPRNTVFDFFGSYRVKRNLEVFVTATNLFDEEYIADGFGQTLGAPRQVSGGVRLYF
jgi:outer membrane receptor protein involved in Fe transport